MVMVMEIDVQTMKDSWAGLCPKCKKSSIYKPGFTLNLKEKCEKCALDLSKNDCADGPAVFMIFVLGFALVPIALFVDHLFHWPLWLHAIMWGILALACTVGMLRPIKAYMISLQYKHRKRDWDNDTRA